MDKSLIIVESPAKIKTIKKFLGPDYEVKATMGHIKDLPQRELGIDIESEFKPSYTIIRGKSKVVKDLRDSAKDRQSIYLALDPDREGEAIAWHISQELKGKKNNGIYRILFNEITEKAVKEAIARPGRIDENKVNAQQARRILDRLVGYKISPLLWRKVSSGLSAGRVQSVALRLICDREKGISEFISQEYWSITAHLRADEPPPFQARLVKIANKKSEIDNQANASEVCVEAQQLPFIVHKVDKKERRRNPSPPFITSTLQQEAFRRLRFPAAKTMRLAQRLYEGLEIGQEGSIGLITYMRTDSTRISQEALEQARRYILESYGKEYIPDKPNIYRSKKGSQDAHEAIRPTSAFRHPDQVRDYLQQDEYQLYRLIWEKFVACQMASAIYDTTVAEIKAGRYTFRATGSLIKFKGFTILYQEESVTSSNGKNSKGIDEKTDDTDDIILPHLQVKQVLTLLKLVPQQHFTQPPPRYTEASLVKELEEKGIGRPSTYATILSIIKDRNYVTVDDRKFIPSHLGMTVNDLLIEHFPDIVDVDFTAKMEENLDEIEEGHTDWVATLKEFYAPFAESLVKANQNMRKAKSTPTSVACSRCGSQMVTKWGRNGEFLACSRYPECKNTAEFIREITGEIRIKEDSITEEQCSKCGKPMVLKNGRFGRFLACSGYPECKNTKPFSQGISCPEGGCEGVLLEKRSKKGRVFYGCSKYPKCKFASWDRPVAGSCPDCGYPILVEKIKAGGEVLVQCPKKECSYRKVS